MTEEKESKKESKDLYVLDEVATQTAVVLRNVTTDEKLDIYGALREILNRLTKIEKAVA